jgi:hypothetical protein
MSEISFIEQRKNSLLRVAQDIFNFKSVLYIGAHKERSQILEEFLKNNYKITLLEVFKPNVDYWKSSGLIDEVVEGDVRTFDSDKKFDVVFWWHGPEHIKEGELLPTLSRIEEIAEKMVVLGCPWGECDQGVSYGNEFETHHTIFNEGYFEKLGYKTDYLGRRDLRLSNICAVKYVAKKLENISYAGANTERV